MKRKSKTVSTIITALGIAVMLGGILIYGLGVKGIIEVTKPAALVLIAEILGIGMITFGVCDFFVVKSPEEQQELEIEISDERNIALGNAAMASGFKVLSVVLAVVVSVLAYIGMIDTVPCLIIIGVYLIGQIVFIARLWYLHRTM